MARDPAFLFYPGDWQGGTSTFSRFMKGAYIDLLIAQFNSGPLSLEEIKIVLGGDFDGAWPTLSKKFVLLPTGLYSNEKLASEKEKRKKFSESRRKNLEGKKEPHIDTHMQPHMENENVNRNKTKGAGIEQYFSDLENSSELEAICRTTNTPKEVFIKYLPTFRTKCELEYPTFQAFVRHFKNSYFIYSKSAQSKGPTRAVEFTFKKPKQ